MKDMLLLSKDTIIAKYINNKLEIVNYDLLPMYLQRNGDFELWLESRAVDPHRATSRFIKKALRLEEKDDLATVIKVNAVTITDTYWVKQIDSNLTYKDVVYNEDFYTQVAAKSYSNLAYTGSGDSLNYLLYTNKLSRTPEATNIGSYEKCWKFQNGNWWIFKKGDRFQRFSELFIYYLGIELGFNMAKYSKTKDGVKTRDFTNNNEYNFEPAFSLLGDNDSLEYAIERLQQIAPQAIPEYVNMIYLDALVRNFDRHTFNFGLLRNPNTGEIISLAPNFDNNNALISSGYEWSNPRRTNDVMVADINRVIENHPTYAKYMPIVTEDMVERAINKTHMKVKKKSIIAFVMNAYSQINFE
ncbi:MAG: hypothetical protein K5923_03070 [Clostridia bacterium]|nr:hypothetical protein [Clostridia bacterium]